VNGYTSIKRDKEVRRAGGVIVYVKNEYPTTICVIGGDDRKFKILWLYVKTPMHTVYVRALYHPPKPIYQVSALLDYIEKCVEELSSSDPGALIGLDGV